MNIRKTHGFSSVPYHIGMVQDDSQSANNKGNLGTQRQARGRGNSYRIDSEDKAIPSKLRLLEVSRPPNTGMTQQSTPPGVQQ